MSRNILIVAAHPDDEVLGCGGTIAKHVFDGDTVHVVFFTDGVGARPTEDAGVTDADSRKMASVAALGMLGVDEAHIKAFSFPDNAMDAVPRLEIVKSLEGWISQVQPSVVYTHHLGDLNVDHRYTYEATMTACRPQPHFSVKEIYSFEVLSSTGWYGVSCNRPFIPSRYVNIEPHLAQKIAALEAYHQEMREFPHARSMDAVLALAKYRGTQAGVSGAEAFCVERIID